jgi:hypothetical protein
MNFSKKLILTFSALMSLASFADERNFKGVAYHSYKYAYGTFMKDCFSDPCYSKAFKKAEAKCKKAGFTSCEEGVSSKETNIITIPRTSQVVRCVVRIKGKN